MASTRRPSAMCSGERDDDAALGEFDERRVGGLQELVEEVGAVERGRQRPEMQRQEDRQRDAGEPVQERREKARLLVRGAHHPSSASGGR